MKTSYQAVLIAACLAWAGCSSVKTHVDTGPIQAKTFSFINTGSRELPSYASQEKQAHEMIQKAITTCLEAKGVKPVPSGGDVIVAYLIIVGDNATTTSLSQYFGYTDDTAALADKIHDQQAVSGGDRSYFEAGTLVIDILDANGTKLLKRATVHSSLLRDVTAEVRQARIQKLVNEALGDLRVSP